MRVQIENRTFAPTEVFRLVTTAALLKSAASQDILGNLTVATAFLSPLDGIADAVADAINARMQTPSPMPAIPATDDSELLFGIRDSEGEPLNSACAVVCNAGTGVKAGDTNASASGRPICTPCDAGSQSAGGNAAECQLCLPGASFETVCKVPVASCLWVQGYVHVACVRPPSCNERVDAGLFQPTEGQSSCISCDILEDAYQEMRGQTSCYFCPGNTRRYLGVLSAENKSSCQCKEGASVINADVFGRCRVPLVVQTITRLAVQATTA